jgi:hypothetical protein
VVRTSGQTRSVTSVTHPPRFEVIASPSRFISSVQARRCEGMMNDRSSKQRNFERFTGKAAVTGGRRAGTKVVRLHYCKAIYLASMIVEVTAVFGHLADRARCRIGSVLNSYCFYLATEPVETGTYFGLPSVPDGMPVGVLILLAAFVVMRRASAYGNGRGEAA